MRARVLADDRADDARRGRDLQRGEQVRQATPAGAASSRSRPATRRTSASARGPAGRPTAGRGSSRSSPGRTSGRWRSTTTASTLWPMAKTIIGARAMIGMVWLATTYGTSARSSSRTWTKTRRQQRARGAPRARTRSPPRASVKSAAPNRYWPRLSRRRRCQGWPNARTMFQMWGSLRSVANGQRNGGSRGRVTRCRGTSSYRHGSPPRNLRPPRRRARRETGRQVTPTDGAAPAGGVRPGPNEPLAAVALATG